MLLRLSVKNLVLIEKLDIEFDSGLNAITGETGAGKTLLVQALGLLLGARANASLVRQGEKQAEVSAIFEPKTEHPVRKILERMDISLSDDEIVIRRVIINSGKSRAYINDTPVSITTLRNIANLLANISSQREQQTLLDESNHLLMLDEFASLSSLRKDVRNLWNTCKNLAIQIEELQRKSRERAQREDFLRYQIEEIDSLNLHVGEDEELEQERKRLMNAESIYNSLAHAESLLYSGEISAVSLVEQASLEIDEAVNLGADGIENINQIVKDSSAALYEASRDISSMLTKIEPNPARLEEIEQRLSDIYTVSRKHGPTVEDILLSRNKMVAELDEISGLEENIEKLQTELSINKQKLYNFAKELSNKRKNAAKRLEKLLTKELQQLSMPNASFQIDVSQAKASTDTIETNNEIIGKNGMDSIRFLFSANSSTKHNALAKVASGGELSRIMLALKTVLIDPEPAMMLLFDEIDAGIGGKTAKLVGKKLKELSKTRQVICITHLPQIAAMANTQFVVEKQDFENFANTYIRKLNAEERILEIARMLSGEQKSKTAIEHAKELLESTIQ